MYRNEVPIVSLMNTMQFMEHTAIQELQQRQTGKELTQSVGVVLSSVILYTCKTLSMPALNTDQFTIYWCRISAHFFVEML